MQRGEAMALQRLLTKRFGTLPADLTTRIAQGSPAQLETWFDRAIDAKTLEAVFGSWD
nr:DUF4351 domain-containing protein [Pseudomonas sp.]